MKNVGEEGKMGFACFLFEIQGTFLFKRPRSGVFNQIEIGYFIISSSSVNMILLIRHNK